MNKLLLYGFGYTASFLAEKYANKNLYIIGTSRNKDKINTNNKFISIIKDTEIDQFIDQNKNQLTHILLSAPPSDKGDPFFLSHINQISKLKHLKWIGYLSATNVYGDHNGGYVNEEISTHPLTKKGKNRLKAERQWRDASNQDSLPLHIFRIAGIYGPKRNMIERIKNNKIKNIFKKGQFFSRIHIYDLIKVIYTSMYNPNEITIYNVADDMPSNSSEVIEFICNLTSIKYPKKISYDPMDKEFRNESFYSENKRIDNTLIKKKLGIILDFPTFKEGYKNILDKE